MFLFVDDNIGILFLISGVVSTIITEIVRLTSTITKVFSEDTELW